MCFVLSQKTSSLQIHVHVGDLVNQVSVALGLYHTIHNSEPNKHRPTTDNFGSSSIICIAFLEQTRDTTYERNKYFSQHITVSSDIHKWCLIL